MNSAVRSRLHDIHTFYQAGRITRRKHQEGWKAIQHLLDFRLKGQITSNPPCSEYISHSAQFDHKQWLQQISSQSSQYLESSANEPWLADDIISIPQLRAMRKKETYPKGAPPIESKHPHPESNLIRMIFPLDTPSSRLITTWAKTVALSIQTIADELKIQAPILPSSPTTTINTHLQVLLWLHNIKALPSSLQITSGPDTELQGGPHDANNLATQVWDGLEELRAHIIDIMISCIFVRAHAEDDGGTAIKKKRKTNDGGSVSTVAITESKNAATEFSEDQCRAEIGKLECRHNFVPFTMYLIAGVRGLFISPKDRRMYSICDCLELMSQVVKIQTSSVKPSSPLEPIWVHTGNYIKSVLESILFNIHEVGRFKSPTRHNLAHAIAHDYMNHVNKQNSSTSFVVPSATPNVPIEID